MTKSLGYISLGCAKNLVDTEVMLGLLKDDGYTITDNLHEADLIIINTCTFIEKAKEEFYTKYSYLKPKKWIGKSV